MNSSDKEEYDDLTVISGIGPTYQRLLRESLNVLTLKDLAALTVDEIESGLQAEGKFVSRGNIEQWIDQARELSATAELSSPANAEPEVPETAAIANSPAVDSKWERVATFVVVFERREAGQLEEQRTTVQQMELEDDIDISEDWPGIESERLSQWMLDRVREELGWEPETELPVEEPAAPEIPTEKPPEAEPPVEEPVAEEISAEEPPEAEPPAEEPVVAEIPTEKPPEAEPTVEEPVAAEITTEKPPEAEPRVEEPAAVEIPPDEPPPATTFPVTVTYGQLRALQPPQTEAPSAIAEAGQLFLGFVKGNQPFALEAHFELAGPAAAAAAKERKKYYVQFSASNLFTGETKSWVTGAQSLVEGELSYTAVLPEAALPPGRYRLRALTTIEGTPSSPNFLEVPLLQIV